MEQPGQTESGGATAAPVSAVRRRLSAVVMLALMALALFHLAQRRWEAIPVPLFYALLLLATLAPGTSATARWNAILLLLGTGVLTVHGWRLLH